MAPIFGQTWHQVVALFEISFHQFIYNDKDIYKDIYNEHFCECACGSQLPKFLLQNLEKCSETRN